MADVQEIYLMTEDTTKERLMKLEKWVIEHNALNKEQWKHRNQQDVEDASRFNLIENKQVDLQIRLGRLEARIAAYVGIIAPLAGALAGVIGTIVIKALSS